MYTINATTTTNAVHEAKGLKVKLLGIVEGDI